MDKYFKQFERACAELIAGERWPGNSGGEVDVESATFCGQAKIRQTLPLAELSRLVVEIEAAAARRGKSGVLFIKHKAGPGKATPLLVIMSDKNWRARTCTCARSSSSS